MTPSQAAFVLITGVGVAAALAAFRVGNRRYYALAKTIASLGFLGTALVLGATHATWSSVALGALVFSAAGDVALAARGTRGFLAGLGLFALAHSVYVVAFVVHGFRPLLLGGTIVLVSVGAVCGWRLLRDRVGHKMRKPVAVYIVVVGSMLAVGTASGITHRAWLLALGVVLVACSDIAVARERFGTSGFVNKLFGLPTYYLGQTLIALSLGAP
ncbi:MAG: lysoplasmalogenase [Coriobacteriia bacterium]|nr:lysoplasmalogenase [Coriobacteriia bacterium]